MREMIMQFLRIISLHGMLPLEMCSGIRVVSSHSITRGHRPWLLQNDQDRHHMAANPYGHAILKATSIAQGILDNIYHHN